MPRFQMSAWVAWAVASQITAAAGALAAPVADISVDAGASFLPGCSFTASGPSQQSQGCLVQAFARTASSAATAAPGFVKATAFSGADAPDLNLGAAFASANARAAMTDYLTFHGPAQTQVTISALLHVSGSVSSDTRGSAFSGIAEASYTVSASLFGANVAVTGSYDDFADGTSTIISPSPNSLVPVSFVVSFDANGNSATGAFQMWVEVQTFANALGSSDLVTGVFLPGHSEATAAFGSTVAWAGITSIVDAQGNPLSGVTVTSDSGLDYMQAAVVPEPTTAALLAVASLAWLLRRRQ